jgi:uncharacterized protein (DUF58 family)
MRSKLRYGYFGLLGMGVGYLASYLLSGTYFLVLLFLLLFTVATTQIVYDLRNLE